MITIPSGSQPIENFTMSRVFIGIQCCQMSNYVYMQEVDPSVESEDLSGEGPDNFVSELANAIPGIDEAMSFAEMLK